MQKEQLINIPINQITLEGILAIPKNAKGIVIFAHGSGSSRHSPRHNYVANILQKEGLGTLLFDLLTKQEDINYQTRFNIDLLVERLEAATKWILNQPQTKDLKIGFFGASTGASAALKTAVKLENSIKAVVSRGGRSDLVDDILPQIKAPTLLIVGSADYTVLELNKISYDLITAEKKLSIIPNATHLFEEPGTLDSVAADAAIWFKKYLS